MSAKGGKRTLAAKVAAGLQNIVTYARVQSGLPLIPRLPQPSGQFDEQVRT